MAPATPTDVTPQGPTVALTPLRGRIVLNGVWNFQPAVEEAAKQPTGDWGAIWVPGNWLGRGSWDQPKLPGIVKKGSSGLWQKLNENLAAAWYEYTLNIPANWKQEDRRIVIDFHRVSTDATVWVNGNKAGDVRWPFGTVDITESTKAGANQLRVLVIATPDANDQVHYMGYASEAKNKSKLTNAGIIGDVVVESMPKGPVISDVFVKPSVRQKNLGLEIELSGVTAPGNVTLKFSAQLANEAQPSFRAEKTVPVVAAKTQTVSVTLPWANPVLWDVNQPNQYNLTIEANGPAGMKDSYAQRFGFREFWIEGRQFYLNGTTLHLRPTKAPEHLMNGNMVAQEMLIRNMQAANFNIIQVWPVSVESRRGYAHFWNAFYEKASELGAPVIGAFPSPNDFFQNADWQSVWAQRKEDYAELSRAVLRRVRNEPSILIWGTAANLFNQSGDQDPRNIGVSTYRKDIPHPRHADWLEFRKIVKDLDSTRPLFTHAGNTYGDVYTANHYLNLTPLQEREEWMSHWAEAGDMPYLAVEFGTPFNINFHRGRYHFGFAITTEPLMTEFLATYFGPEAYRKETDDYRRLVVAMKHQKDQLWERMQLEPLIAFNEQFQECQSLFIRNTWRTWRTAGVSGGMIPWYVEAMLWQPGTKEQADVPPFTPGSTGAYEPGVITRAMQYLREPAVQPLAGAKTLVESNRPTLAWVAGSPDIYDKAHSFRSGETVTKLAALLNDQRKALPYKAEWTVELGGKVIAEGKNEGQIAPGDQARVPIKFTVPAVAAGSRAEGRVALTATIGGDLHTDDFTFRAFPDNAAPATAKTWLVADPVGATTKFLKQMGVATKAWDGKPDKGAILAVGRGAFEADDTLGPRVQAFVQQGGRAIVFAQTPEWYRAIGVRVSHHVARRVFPVDPEHPVMRGLDAEDLRDWRGAGSLIEAKPKYSPTVTPSFGWHWGNRHSVSSAALEKPHRSGWRPLLECEFDLAYSPLLELDHGAGRAWLCTLDFEERGDRDPALEELFRNLASYAETSQPLPRASRTIYVGSKEGETFLKNLSVSFTRSEGLTADAELAIIGEGANVSAADLTAWAESGRNAFVLPSAKAGVNHFGADIKTARRFGGSLTPPPAPIGSGLSLSDLHIRTMLDYRVVGGGAHPFADGLIGVQRPGDRGWIVHSQINPKAFDTQAKPYLRFSAWRFTRANAQLLANLGATFTTDDQIFNPRIERIPLAGPWKAKLITALPQNDASKPHSDPGMSPGATAAVKPGVDTSDWDTINLPDYWRPLDKNDGEAVFVRQVRLPSSWADKVMMISLGRIDNYDKVYLNGTLIGSTDEKPGDPKFNPWNDPREYRVSAGVVAPQQASTDQAPTGKLYVTLAVRLFDRDSGGGIHGRPEEMSIRVLDQKLQQDRAFYVPGYIEEHKLGDDPARYFRW